MIRSLRLMDFRCYKALDIEAPAAGAILTGNNAQGKTSILEALCVLIRLHSPRTHRMASMIRRDASGFGIAGDPFGMERQVRYSREGLVTKVDDELRDGQSSYLRDGGLVVWMGNEDLELIRGPGEARRRYLDFLGAQLDPAYRQAWSRYRRALRSKNLLLKEGRNRDAEIASYEELLIEHGTVLMQTRARLVAELAPLAAAAQQSIGGGGERLSLDYLPASGEDLRASLLQAREREQRLRQAVVGPHRDDVSLRIGGAPASEFASEGQQRTLALALKLAQGTLLERDGGSAPIYLIDDVFGELDPTRRHALMRHLPIGAQKWITTTTLDWWNETDGLKDVGRFELREGRCFPR